MKPAYLEVMEWAKQELEQGNRLKASRIQRVAEQMEARYEAEQKRLVRERSTYYY